MQSSVTFDRMRFLRRLEKSCQSALHEAHAFPCEETAQRASGRLDGLLHGAAAVLFALDPDGSDPTLLEDARTIVERFRAELAALIAPHP